MNALEGRARWIALILLCLGDLMIVVDMTIVNVALPSIRTDLGFTETTLVWVVNAFLLTYSGCLLLGGRLGDIYGHRRIFLAGIVAFTVASLLCGIAQTQGLLVIARALQGIGGAVVSAVALSLILTIFTDPRERARAMGLFGFVAAGGGAIGVLLGGLLTNSFDWHWNFLVNVPIGITVFFASRAYLPHSRAEEVHDRLDLGGAVLITGALMLAVYAIVGGNASGWLSPRTLGLFGGALALLLGFLVLEGKVRAPLVPLHIFRDRNIMIASCVGILWSAAMFAAFFISALYLQLVLGFDPLQVGLSFLPTNVIMAVFSLGLSAAVVMRFGTRGPLALGMTLVGLSLAAFGFAPADGSYWVHVLPGMIGLGIGAGMAFNPLLLAATSEVPEAESGLASGVLNTAFMMGGALGLAILASIAASRTGILGEAGVDQLVALNGGYQAAFLVGAVAAFIAAGVALLFKVSAGPSRAPATH
ncbi:MAG: MFS transporter [Candidatus Pacebacteria bacterium]|nr:MFS transporter [Candidatus Paceibacterota bacterium]